MSINVQTNYEKTASKNAYFNTDKNVIEQILFQITPSSKKRDIQEAYARLFSYLLLCRHANKSKRSNWSHNAVIQRSPLGKDNVRKAFKWLAESYPKKPIIKKSGSPSKPNYEVREFEEPVQLQSWIFDGSNSGDEKTSNKSFSWFYYLPNLLSNNDYYLASMFMIKVLIETSPSEVEFPEKCFKLKDILQFNSFERHSTISHENELKRWGLQNIKHLFSYGYLTYNVYINDVLIQCNIDGLKNLNEYAERRFEKLNSNVYPSGDCKVINPYIAFEFTIVPSNLLIDDDFKNLFEANLIDEIDGLELPSHLLSKQGIGLSNNLTPPPLPFEDNYIKQTSH